MEVTFLRRSLEQSAPIGTMCPTWEAMQLDDLPDDVLRRVGELAGVRGRARLRCVSRCWREVLWGLPWLMLPLEPEDVEVVVRTCSPRRLVELL